MKTTRAAFPEKADLPSIEADTEAVPARKTRRSSPLGCIHGGHNQSGHRDQRRRLTRKRGPDEAWIGAIEARLSRKRNRYIGGSKMTAFSMAELDLQRLEAIQRLVERRTGVKPSKSVVLGAGLEALEEALG